MIAMCWRAVLVICVGCGRIAFDPRGDGGGLGDGLTDAVAQCASFGPWSTPVHIAASNAATIYDEWQPALHPNNLLLVFESNRPVGSHLFAMTRASETDAWGPARDLAELYGTTNQDGGISPMFSTDGSQLYYVHYMAIGSGPAVAPFLGGDMFGANTPADLPYPDVDWTMSDDELELFWTDTSTGPNAQLRHARRPNTSASWVTDTEVDSLNTPGISRGWPGFDDARQELYYEDQESAGTYIAVAKRASPMATFDAPTLLMQLGSDVGDPEISFDGKTLVFASTRAGGGGASDLYFVTRQCQ
jgi:hypothetical protein